MHEHTASFHAGQHFVIGNSRPFKCFCGQEFTKLYSLERHVRVLGEEKHPESGHPCPKCPAYQGKNAFLRKDHLVQHYRYFHKYTDDQLKDLFPPRVQSGARRFVSPATCHFETCEYYRGPEFTELDYAQQERNRPFNKQSEYTMHMRQEHNWSPYPCRVSGCDKLDAKGYFSISALEKHYKEKHPRSNITPQNTRKGVTADTGKVKCNNCKKLVATSYMKYHLDWYCKGKVQCSWCNDVTESRRLGGHHEYSCNGEVACQHCGELMESRQLKDHNRNCKGKVTCGECGQITERRFIRMYPNHCADCRRALLAR